MTCSCSPVYVINYYYYCSIKKTKRKEVSALILILTITEITRERDRIKKRTDDTINAPVMVTVLVLLCFEQNLVGTTPPTLSPPEPTTACWFLVVCWCWCSLVVPPVPPPEVFIVRLLLCVETSDETKKKRDKFLRTKQNKKKVIRV